MPGPVKTCKSSPDKPVMTISACGTKGKRQYMEDYYDIAFNMKLRLQDNPGIPHDYFYFAVYDGHGGREAAQFARENLLRSIHRNKDFWSDNDEDILRAIRNGFADTQASMREAMPNWVRTNKSLPSTAGTTASVLFIKNGKFYSGHVGDSRIVICRENPETKQWIADQLTEDHKPESEREIERIHRAGGDVKSKLGVQRVVWKRPCLSTEEKLKTMEKEHPDQYKEFLKSTSNYPIDESLVQYYQSIPFLAIARSLGDFWSLNQHTGRYVISPEPDVFCRPITPEDKCVLLATDGLWNVINSTLAARFLQELNILKTNERKYHENEYFVTDNFYDVAGVDTENHALSLVYYAYQTWERKRLRSDNITVVTAMLQDKMAHCHDSFYENLDAIHANPKLREDMIRRREKRKLSSIWQRKKNGEFFGQVWPDRILDINGVGESFSLFSTSDLKEDSLIFSPDFISRIYHQPARLVRPKNYTKIINAPCRAIQVDPGNDDDSFIYIKNVSDDPSDEHPLPVRLNKAGKEVRDASAQASQSMHDFGQSWLSMPDGEDDNLEDQETHNESKIIESSSIDNINSSMDSDSENNIESLSPLSESDLESSPDKSEQRGDEIAPTFDDVIRQIKEEELLTIYREEESMPQLRCLLNCTTPLRRSARKAYMSLSDNAKRKIQANLNVTLDKAKRRKSQPNFDK